MWCGLLRVAFITLDTKLMQDCVGIWRIQKEKFDEAYLRTRAGELGVTHLLREVTTTTTQPT